jgi:hypothetical protein
MSEETQRDTPVTSERDSAGVLANLPRSRPQRSSARRVAARDGASSGAARRASTPSTGTDEQAASASQPAANRASGSAKRSSGARKARTASGSSSRARAGRPASGAAGTRARRQTAATGSASKGTRAPRQGFESDADSTSGPVMPPGAGEILTAATELIADVAKSGLSRGTSTLNGILQRLHLS